MSIEELSPELKEQLKNCTTKEEAESCLKKNAVGLSMEEMEKICGGGLFSGTWCWPWAHHWERTGKTRERIRYAVKLEKDYFTTDEEFRCTICGDTKWEVLPGGWPLKDK